VVEQRRTPNILLVMADQLIPMLCGAYGHPVVQTPALDMLASRGVRFDAAYTPVPVCAPARACLMTGTYSSTNRVYDNAALFAADLPTIPHYLSRAGYDCVLSGKMHFVGPDQLHGFQRRLTTDIYPEEFTWVANRAPWVWTRDPKTFDPIRGTGNHARNYVGSGIHVGRWHHHLGYDEEAHFRALQYLRAQGITQQERVAQGREAERPFFLCVSYHHPHDPFWPPRELWDLYADAEIAIPRFPADLEATYSAMDRWLNAQHGVARFPELRDPDSLRRVRRAYYAMVTYIDRKVGELVATLQHAGLWDTTLVLFASDHGDMLGEKGMVQKRSFYDYSSRVPLIVRFPDEARKGTTCSEPVSLVDVFPTLLDLAGVPSEERLPVDGVSLLEVIDRSPRSSRTIYAEMHVEDMAATCFMARQGRFKYIYVHGETPQLFDMEEDPGEWHNLAGDQAHRATETALRSAILGRFSPDGIEAEIRSSLRRRLVIKEAMERNGTLWDYAPAFDAARDALGQYRPPR
jgi:choline-sulfatase